MNTTDIAALRRRSNNLRTADQTDAFIDLLLDKLEAERQQREGAEAELAELRGEQAPFRYVVVKEKVNIGYTQTLEDADFMSLQHGGVVIPLYASQPKPVVVLTEPYDDGHGGEWFSKSTVENMLKDADIVVKDGE